MGYRGSMPPLHERRARSGEADRPPARKRWGQHFLARPEIAERTGLTHGSVRVNLHRGVEMLRQRLREDTGHA